MIKYLAEHGRRPKDIPARSATAWATAQALTVRRPSEANAATLVAHQAVYLLHLDREIKDIDELVARRFRTHLHAKITGSLPGFGPILCAEFIVAAGGSPAGFATSGHLASNAGLIAVSQDPSMVSDNLHRPKPYNGPPGCVGFLFGHPVRHLRDRPIGCLLRQEEC
jgi:hypothetical protein